MSKSQTTLKIMVVSALVIITARPNLPAYAFTTTGDMNVSADINASCIMSSTDLDFGDYDATGINATEDLEATATITTTCSSGTTAYVIMDNGLHSTREQRYAGRSIRFTDYRHMSNAVSDSKLQYELYTNENHSIVWHVTLRQDIVGSGASEDLPIYAKVFKNQLDAAAGSYTDTINITLNY